MIIEFEIDQKRLLSYKIIPILIDKKFVPQPLCGAEAKRLINKISKLSHKIMSYNKNFASTQYAYRRDVKKAELLHKLENRLFFIQNLFKYNPSILTQSLINFIISRSKRNIGA